LTEQQVATEGWNWGDVAPLDGDAQSNRELKVMVNGKLGFDVPLAELSQVSVVGNTDLTMEFAQSGAAIGDEVMTELRLFIPGGGDPGAITADSLREGMQRAAGLGTAGEALLIIRDIMLNAPRGKHDFEFHKKSIKIRGKTQTHNVRYENIARIFYLDLGTVRLGGYSTALALGLDQPIRQGQTLHHWLVLNFDAVKTVPPETVSEEAWRASGTQKGEHKQDFMVGKLVSKLAGRTPIATFSKFKEVHPQKEPGLKCSHKAQPGLLYFTKKSFLFVMKPVVWYRYADVEAFHFEAGQLRGRSYDLFVVLKSGQQLEFSQIDRSTFEAVDITLRELELPIKGAEKLRDSSAAAGGRPQRTAKSGAGQAPAAGAAAGRGGAARGSSRGGAAPPKEDDYDEDEDGDFTDEEGDDDGSASSSDEMEDDEEDKPAPKSKRPRRS